MLQTYIHFRGLQSERILLIQKHTQIQLLSRTFSATPLHAPETLVYKGRWVFNTLLLCQCSMNTFMRRNIMPVHLPLLENATGYCSEWLPRARLTGVGSLRVSHPKILTGRFDPHHGMLLQSTLEQPIAR